MTTAAGATALFGRHPQYEAGLMWIRDFVLRPHPQLGRRGKVCPQLAPAMDADQVWLATFRSAGSSAAHAAAAGPALAGLFRRLPTRSQLPPAALLAFFPDVDAGSAGEFIDGGHQVLRPQFVEQGLMLGEFHATSTVGSVRNRLLPVMRCPVPMFAVRGLSPHDLLFLDQPDTAPQTRLTYLRDYERHLGAVLPAPARADLDTRLAAASQALSVGSDDE